MSDHVGERYGRLVITARAPNSANLKNQNTRWVCECDCGNTHVVQLGNLRRGRTTSCGCQKYKLIAAQVVKHGNASRGNKTTEYKIWCGIKTRCLNPNSDCYGSYGGRGITVCDRWRDSFENFLSDVGCRPSARYSIDRIDNDRGYEPGNVRWATAKEQRANQRPARSLKARTP